MDHISLETELSARSRRAYRALDEAEKARRTLAETSYDGFPARVAEEASHAHDSFMNAHVFLAGREPYGGDQKGGIDSVHHGEELSAQHAPKNPRDAAIAREAAIELRNTGLTALRFVEISASMTHLEIDGDGYDRLRDAACRLIGNSEALRDTLAEDFVDDADRLLAEERARGRQLA